MRELAVGTQTTPVELANFFNMLEADAVVGGKPGADGAVVLFGRDDGHSAPYPASGRTVIAARVAIEVVLQQVDGMPGARPLLDHVRKQLAGDMPAQVACLAPTLTLLAKLYWKTIGAMPCGPAQIRMAPRPACAWSDGNQAGPAAVTAQQQQALEALIDRLMQLHRRSKQPDRQ